MKFLFRLFDRKIQEVLDAPDKEFIFTFMVSNSAVSVIATSAPEALAALMALDYSVQARANAFLVDVSNV